MNDPTTTRPRKRWHQRWSVRIPLAFVALLVVVSIVDPTFGQTPDQPATPAQPVEAPAPAAAPPPPAGPVLPVAVTEPQVDALVAELAALYPVPDPRDNTDFCRAAGCVQMVTTGAVTVSQWPTEADAVRWAEAAVVDADQAGRFVLSYAGTDQQFTSDEARAAWAARTAEFSA